MSAEDWLVAFAAGMMFGLVLYCVLSVLADELTGAKK